MRSGRGKAPATSGPINREPPPMTHPTIIPTPYAAARQMRRANARPSLPALFIVMIDYGRPYVGKRGPSGCAADVDPEITRREVISRIVSGEYTNIRFIQEVRDGIATDVTLEMQVAASVAAMGRKIAGAFTEAVELYNEWNEAIGRAPQDQDEASADMARVS